MKGHGGGAIQALNRSEIGSYSEATQQNCWQVRFPGPLAKGSHIVSQPLKPDNNSYTPISPL